jgi:hypothetical protein
VIESALLRFPPDIRDEMSRGAMSLQLLFGRRSTDPQLEDAYVQLEGGVADLITSSAIALLSANGRNRWADGLVQDAQTFAPDLYARARKFSR